MQGSQVVTTGNRIIRSLGAFEGSFGKQRDNRIDRRIHVLNLLQVSLHHFQARNFLTANPLSHFRGGPITNLLVGHHWVSFSFRKRAILACRILRYTRTGCLLPRLPWQLFFQS